MPRADNYREGISKARKAKRKANKERPISPVCISGDVRFKEQSLAMITCPTPCRIVKLQLTIPQTPEGADFLVKAVLRDPAGDTTLYESKLVSQRRSFENLELREYQNLHISVRAAESEQELQPFPYSISYLIQLKDG